MTQPKDSANREPNPCKPSGGGDSAAEPAAHAAANHSDDPAARVRAPQEDDNLDPARETPLWQGRTSWKRFTHLFLIAAVWTVITIIVAVAKGGVFGWACFAVAMLLWLGAAGRGAYGVLSQSYRLTNQRLFIERGLLSKTIDQTELIRVDDVRVHKSLQDRILGLGTIEIMSTDMSDRDITIVGVTRPEEIADYIRQHMRIQRRRSLYVENL